MPNKDNKHWYSDSQKDLPTHPPTYLPDHSLSHFWFTVALLFKTPAAPFEVPRGVVIWNPIRRHNLTQKDNWKDNVVDLWHVRHWLQFWQLRPWIYDNNCFLTVNCDTGQHLQFLWCFQNAGKRSFFQDKNLKFDISALLTPKVNSLFVYEKKYFFIHP